MSPRFGMHAKFAKVRRLMQESRCDAEVRGVHARAGVPQEPRHRDAAAAEPDHRDLAARQQLPHHLSLSVLSARNAQRMPRIQNRTTTFVSGHPFSSK